MCLEITGLSVVTGQFLRTLTCSRLVSQAQADSKGMAAGVAVGKLEIWNDVNTNIGYPPPVYS